MLAASPLGDAWVPSVAAPLRSTKLRGGPEDSLRYFGPKTTPLLDSIKYPADMKRLTVDELKQLSYELR
jgi:hypothetical protein